MAGGWFDYIRMEIDEKWIVGMVDYNKYGIIMKQISFRLTISFRLDGDVRDHS